MRRRSMAPDEWQYGERASEDVRGLLLGLMLEFVRAARELQGVDRIAVLGSILTDKPRPKDADLLVSIAGDADFTALARFSRRFMGKAQGINSGADVFLADDSGAYIGRVCHYRECHPRVMCRARHCGARPHLDDDLDVVNLSAELIAAPPLVVYPVVMLNVPAPTDLRTLLLLPLQQDGRGA